jgi:hypothetical protein
MDPTAESLKRSLRNLRKRPGEKIRRRQKEPAKTIREAPG